MSPAILAQRWPTVHRRADSKVGPITVVTWSVGYYITSRIGGIVFTPAVNGKWL